MMPRGAGNDPAGASISSAVAASAASETLRMLRFGTAFLLLFVTNLIAGFLWVPPFEIAAVIFVIAAACAAGALGGIVAGIGSVHESSAPCAARWAFRVPLLAIPPLAMAIKIWVFPSTGPIVAMQIFLSLLAVVGFGVWGLSCRRPAVRVAIYATVLSFSGAMCAIAFRGYGGEILVSPLHRTVLKAESNDMQHRWEARHFLLNQPEEALVRAYLDEPSGDWRHRYVAALEANLHGEVFSRVMTALAESERVSGSREDSKVSRPLAE